MLYNLLSGFLLFLGMIFVFVYEVITVRKKQKENLEAKIAYRYLFYALFFCVEVAYSFFMRFYNALMEILK